MSVELSAAAAKSLEPRSFGSSDEDVIWSGRGTEGIKFCLPASLGILVPVTAMSSREPPVCGSS